MRNLDECRAEVFRRSDEKIKQRNKRQKRALGISIPAFACVLIVAVVLPNMSGFLSKETSTAHGEDNAPMQSQTLESYEYLVEIDGSGNYYTTFTDSQKTQELSEYLNSFFEEEKPADTNTTVQESTGQSANTLDENKKRPYYPYTIKITTTYGEEIIYTLKGNILYCQNTGESTVLTDDEVTELKRLMKK